MRTLKIKTKNFLNWYYNCGSDQEQEETALNLGYRIIEGLFDGGISIVPEEILNECNHEIIPLMIIEGYNNSDKIVSDIFSDYEIVLID
jgi:hypothetical protein